MKTRLLLTAFALTGFASAGTYVYSGSWNIDVASTIDSGSTINSTLISRNNATVSLPFYNASEHNGETLTSVQIRYVLPQAANSANITETIGSTTGETFTATTFTATTTVRSSDLNDLLFGYSEYSKALVSGHFAFTRLGATLRPC